MFRETKQQRADRERLDTYERVLLGLGHDTAKVDAAVEAKRREIAAERDREAGRDR